MNATAPVLPGETLAGKYRVERVLGQGGMGVVVTARHLELDERVAIKFLVGQPSQVAVDRFLREARAAVKVKGEHVCRVFDFGRLEETLEPYIVMEHLEGTDLARKLEREGPQPVEAVVGWILEACDALAEAHALGIVHRDLKPANIFLATRPDGSTCAKVLDFGISKLPKAEVMTQTAAIMGSPVYMSPEQMESARDVDATSDVWSLGVMLYELVGGRPPFLGESMVQLAIQVREKEPRPLQELVPGVPDRLVNAITKCLSKSPGARYASVAELAADLAPLAPPEVSAIAMRLARRLVARRSDPASGFDSAIGLAATARPEPEEGAPSSPVVGEHVARGRGTFAPLQSTMGDTPPATRRRGPVSLVLVVAMFALVLAFAIRALVPSKDAAEGAPLPPPSGVLDSALEATETPASAAPPPVAAPSASSAFHAPSEVAPPVTTPSAKAPVVKLTTTPPASGAQATATAAAAASSVAPDSTRLPPAPAPHASPPATRKPRELDRDDP
jgi:eukaryotic-like serine/threonine-protein kinase